MRDLRNQEGHANLKPVTEAEADEMCDASKEMISLIHEDLA